MNVASRIKHGLYGGKVQFYLVGVDGTCAQLGENRPSDEELKRVIPQRERAHNSYVRRFWRENKWPKPLPLVAVSTFEM